MKTSVSQHMAELWKQSNITVAFQIQVDHFISIMSVLEKVMLQSGFHLYKIHLDFVTLLYLLATRGPSCIICYLIN